MSTATVATVNDAKDLLADLRTRHDDVAVFWDRGWGDHGETPNISIITGGNGDQPHAKLTKEVYAALVDQGVIAEDGYIGFKARRYHAYQPAPATEKTGPTPNEVAEEVLRSVFADHDGLPLKTAFHRGFRKDPYNPIVEDVLTTTAYGNGAGYVNISPGCAEAYISAWTAGYWGDRVGDGVTVEYPKGQEQYSYGGFKPDLGAMREPGFRDALLEAIRSQLALLNDGAVR